MAKSAERSVGSIPVPQHPRTSRPQWNQRDTATRNKQPRRSQRARNRGMFAGCGFLTVVVALFAIIALVGFLVAAAMNKEHSGSERIPVPSDIPPAAARPAPTINIHGSGRSALQLRQWAEPLAEKTGIPVQALMAYGNAEVIARQTRPACGLTWNTLAGLGYVETLHGTYDGQHYGVSKLNDEGFAEPPIFGPQLNG